MQLYDFPAPTPRRVRMFLAEKGIAIPRVNVDITAGEQFRPAFRALNPSCTVPALLLDNGNVLSEVPAIWHFLEATFAGPPMLGETPEETATILMWERRMEFDGYFAAAEAFRNSAPAFANRALTGIHKHDQIEAVAKRGRTRVMHFYADLDARLKTTPFVAGPKFTAADITAVVSVDFANSAVGIDIPSQYNNLLGWRKRIAERPSYTA
ncbi:MAG: glutathione S-transferase [Bradyrhizobium sp.]